MSETLATELKNGFLEAMSDVASAVSVVTTLHEGKPHGTTVSAFCSLSVDPPMVLISLDKTSRLLNLVMESGRFGLNVLAHDQATIARHFASKSDDKFAGVEFDEEYGAPRIIGATSWLMCDVEQSIVGGDHIVIFGRIIDARAHHLEPLTYHSRSFGTHSAIQR